jgi:hypothetical protein
MVRGMLRSAFQERQTLSMLHVVAANSCGVGCIVSSKLQEDVRIREREHFDRAFLPTGFASTAAQDKSLS